MTDDIPASGRAANQNVSFRFLTENPKAIMARAVMRSWIGYMDEMNIPRDMCAEVLLDAFLQCVKPKEGEYERVAAVTEMSQLMRCRDRLQVMIDEIIAAYGDAITS
ncbi:hypothetical protein GC177_00845 [bacterium]|nr:hypothetical protein [bacterium]